MGNPSVSSIQDKDDASIRSEGAKTQIAGAHPQCRGWSSPNCTHRVRLPFSSVFRRDGAARRDPCGANREALFPVPAPVPVGDASDGVAGVTGSGFTVMLDLPLSVLEPVMELKRDVSSGRDIVTACWRAKLRSCKAAKLRSCEAATRAVTKGWSRRGPFHAFGLDGRWR